MDGVYVNCIKTEYGEKSQKEKKKPTVWQIINEMKYLQQKLNTYKGKRESVNEVEAVKLQTQSGIRVPMNGIKTEQLWAYAMSMLQVFVYTVDEGGENTQRSRVNNRDTHKKNVVKQMSFVVVSVPQIGLSG